MSAVAFDTLKFANRLKDAGVPAKHAEAEAEALAEAFSANIGDLATKQDLRELSTELRSEMGQLRAELRGEMGQLRGEMGQMRAELREMELRMTIKLGTLLAVGIGAVAALVKIL